MWHIQGLSSGTSSTRVCTCSRALTHTLCTRHTHYGFVHVDTHAGANGGSGGGVALHAVSAGRPGSPSTSTSEDEASSENEGGFVS
jgi:hypothetical protein